MTYTSDQILEKEDLYDLQDKVSLGITFKYQLTKGEIGWLNHIRNKYCIYDAVTANLDGNVLTFSMDSTLDITKALEDDTMHPKAVMLSDETALQKIFFWIA